MWSYLPRLDRAGVLGAEDVSAAELDGSGRNAVVVRVVGGGAAHAVLQLFAVLHHRVPAVQQS